MTYTKETLQEAIVQKLRLNYGCTEMCILPPLP